MAKAEDERLPFPALTIEDEDEVPPQTSLASDLAYVAKKHPTAVLGLVLLLAIVAAAVLAPVLAPYGPQDLAPIRANQPPSARHFFGTDQFGHDVFSRVLWAARLDLLIAFTAVTISVILGVLIGGASGYAGGWADELTMRAMDMVQSFPRLIFAMGIAFALGPGIGTVIAATSLLNIPGYARLVRNLILSAKRSQYAMAAVMVGNSPARVLYRHLVPNCMGPVLAQATLHAGWAILEAAGLSFLGLGVPVPRAEWGVMISMGLQEFLRGHWWIYTFPGLAMGVAVLGFNLLGDGVQDILDPRRRGGG